MVYIVDLEEKECIVTSSGKVIYQGDEAGYDKFVQENKKSAVFIINDIPRLSGE